uniref:J domain-containing protein n=1 Tax=Chenopodium quinoa TaxID=63459 RepID=A0A803MNC4_CHEQI
MARRGNQPKRGIDQTSSKSKKKDPDVKGFVDELLSGEHLKSPLTDCASRTSAAGDGGKKNKKSKNVSKKGELKVDGVAFGSSVPDNSVSGESMEKLSRDFNTSHVSNGSSGNHDGADNHSVNGSFIAGRTDKLEIFRMMVLENLRHYALSILRISRGWLERQQPVFAAVVRNVYRVLAFPSRQHSAPCVNGLVGLCFSWHGLLSADGNNFLLFYPVVQHTFRHCNDWDVQVSIGVGLAFILSRERISLSVLTVYSVYCAWAYVGWLGVLLGFNLSFISSDALIYFLKNNIDERKSKSSDRADGVQGDRSFFNGEAQFQYPDVGSGKSMDRNAGVASTSGADSEITSEDEVVRLLNCTDHYSALGLSRYQQVDESVLKKEYRKKAMLVHPDKNMGNEKAAEAFKKLQNAYEVLLDSLKRKAYDDELRKEELLSYFCRFQRSSQKSGRHGFFPNGFARSEGDGKDPLGEARRIACKKCGSFHIWLQTKKSKLKARWCQDCEELHQAKDGDGWVEQSSQPLLFGILRKVDVPVAYVCADGRVYDATEWYICQEENFNFLFPAMML